MARLGETRQDQKLGSPSVGLGFLYIPFLPGCGAGSRARRKTPLEKPPPPTPRSSSSLPATFQAAALGPRTGVHSMFLDV